MKKPMPTDFGLTDEEYRRLAKSPGPLFNRVTFAVLSIVTLGVSVFTGVDNYDGNLPTFFIFFFLTLPAAGLAAAIVAVIIDAIVEHFRPAYGKKKMYENALRAYRLTLAETWMSMGGRQFEISLGILYLQLGYDVKHTGHSGDKGADLVLKKDGRTTVVQCKAHKSPVGPAVARELYGTMSDRHADRAVLASTSGFTRGVREFVLDKPIDLVQPADFVRMIEDVETGDRDGRKPVL